jgi:ADP-ribose pyrophosphatase YjhB (NUDIX family)
MLQGPANAMKYCSECGAKVAFHARGRGSVSRFVCTACRRIFFQDPRLAAGCIAEWDGQILLCRRAIAPAHGLWGLPAGFVADGESVSAAAIRETLEEANVAVEIHQPFALFHIPHANQLRVIYLARLLDNHFKAGPETIEARLFEESQVPWNDLAFTTTHDALRRYFQDRASGSFGFFVADIVSFESSAIA